MKLHVSFSHRGALLLLCAIALWPGRAPAATADSPEAALDRAIGDQKEAWNAPAAVLIGAVRTCATQDSFHAAIYVADALTAGRRDTDAIAPFVVTAAIQGVRQALIADRASVRSCISTIVTAAVRASPGEVLEIVSAAVKASPADAAPVIVAAAAKSVPDPASEVNLKAELTREHVSIDGKEGKDLGAYASQGVAVPLLPGVNQEMTLAEAIVQTALQADPSLDPALLSAAASVPLGGNPSNPLTPLSMGVVALSPLEVISPTVPLLPGAPVAPTPPKQSPVSP